MLAFEVGLPLTLSSQASTHSSVAATSRNIDLTNFQIVRSVLWSHCCEFVMKCVKIVALSKPYYCLFKKKNSFTLSILASDLGFQRLVFVVGQNVTAERAVWEDALSSCTAHLFFLSTIIRPFLTNILC